jgi:hypothetical protein
VSASGEWFYTWGKSVARLKVLDTAESLYFLDAAIADATIAQSQRTQAIETFLAGIDDEIEIHVKNVTLDELARPPYKAAVDFEKVHYGLGNRQEKKRESNQVELPKTVTPAPDLSTRRRVSRSR